MKHYNTSITDDAYRIFNLKGEPIEEIAPFIQPTKEVRRIVNVVRSAASSGATTTIYATPSDKDFYLTNAILTKVKDVASAGVYAVITATINGVSTAILRTSGITLTAERDMVSLNLMFPLKIDRGTNITLGWNLNSAVEYASGMIFGYTEETTKGV